MRAVLASVLAAATLLAASPAPGQELSSKEVLRSIDDGKQFLVARQNGDGSWGLGGGGGNAKIGGTSLAVLALINAGMEPTDPPVRRGLEYLRAVRDGDFASQYQTYEVSLLIMALAAAKGGPRDQARLLALTTRLEAGQLARGENAGSWTYSLGNGLLFNLGGDRSNGQFAVLALREAAYAGIPVDRKTWEAIRDHWMGSQNADGGWGYSGMHNQGSYGSMTVAGISTLSIVKTMLRQEKLNRAGLPDCCESDPVQDAIDQALDRASRWMENHFAVGHNPGSGSNVLYYLYGLERAGRLSGRRFFGEHDWYREGAEFLVRNQTARDGAWRGVGGLESDPVLGTCFSLLFLSKGLAPVLVNKLKYGPADRAGEVDGDDWRRQPNDARNLTEFVSGLPKWPKLVTWQTLDLPKAMRTEGVGDFLQAPILYVAGSNVPAFSDAEATRLREYVDQGGFVFAVANCERTSFERGLRELVGKMYPNGEGELKRLAADHPIYRAEYNLDADAVELWGVEVGCRTALVFSPDDLACYWERWLPFDPEGRPAKVTAAITQKMRVGVNVVAYATGREPPTKLDVEIDPGNDGEADEVERGLLQVAKLRHGGQWDAAPRALRNLLIALNKSEGGLAASTKQNTLVASDPDLYKYPLVYMHGRTNFRMGPKEVERLREHLGRGAVLFADACCGAPAFDASFRDLAEQLYPDAELKRIPADHELFGTAVGHDLSRVRRRAPGTGANGVLDAGIVVGEPVLEGIEVDGRLVLIYSKYDISCALEKQSSAACAGYVPEDAVRIAVNVVLYAMLQDVALLDEQ